MQTRASLRQAPCSPTIEATFAVRCRPTLLASAQLGCLSVDDDALGPHLIRLLLVRVTYDPRGSAGLEHIFRQPSIAHSRRWRQDDEPNFSFSAVDLKLDQPVRVGIARLAD